MGVVNQGLFCIVRFVTIIAILGSTDVEFRSSAMIVRILGLLNVLTVNENVQ